MTNEPNPNSPSGTPSHTPPGAHAANDHEAAPDHAAVSSRGASVGVILVLIIAVGLAGFGIWKRRSNDKALVSSTNELAAPSVIAIPPKVGAPTDEFVLPGNVSAFSDSPIYARTSGYLTRWYYDIGAKVKKGSLLAEIATPELDQQLAQAQADLSTSESNASNAHTQAERYKGLVASDAVSQQDTETFVNQAASTSATVRSQQANVQRLKELQGFEKIYAPFDGVVTARSIDTGQLINEGATNELFHLQAIQTLRVYTNLPQVYSQNIKRGGKIPLTFPEHPGKIYQGTLVRSADAIDPSNRTLLVEVDVDNRDGELMPGSLAQVHFKTAQAGNTFIVPVSALIFRREGLRVATVVNGDVAHLVPIVIGRDDGATVEVVSGLSESDQVIQDPPDSIIEGEKLHVEHPGQQTAGQQSSSQQNADANNQQKQNEGGKK